ncbi:MAG: carboxypeptidase-like regulatory domain-containing protein, partial [Chitinophagaceae bacterium]
MGNPYLFQSLTRTFFIMLLAAICLLNPGNTFAGDKRAKINVASLAQTITGTISDASSGKPLPGASITVLGQKQRTLSDANGSFSIEVPGASSVIEITYIGYATQQITVGTTTQLEITLQPNSADLAQVVVVGYGTQNKRNVTGAV